MMANGDLSVLSGRFCYRLSIGIPDHARVPEAHARLLALRRRATPSSCRTTRNLGFVSRLPMIHAQPENSPLISRLKFKSPGEPDRAEADSL